MENTIIVEEGETIFSDEAIDALNKYIEGIQAEKEYNLDLLYFLDSPYLCFDRNEHIPKEYIDSVIAFHKEELDL